MAFKLLHAIDRVMDKLRNFKEEMQCWYIQPTSQQIVALEEAVAAIDEAMDKLRNFKEEMQ